MSRRYSSSRGQSGSKKPLLDKAQSWIRYSPEEVELLVVKLHKEGKTTSTIGKILRDSYGVPNVALLTGKKLTKILKEHKVTLKLPEDMTALMVRALALREHIENNHQDQSAKRGLVLTESKIRKLVKYYIKSKVLDANWKYEPRNLKVILG